MGLLRIACVAALVAVGRPQELSDCDVNATNPWTVSNTEEAAALSASLNCSNGDFAVEWFGTVFVSEAIRVTSGTSLNITGVGPLAIADGLNVTQLFYVEGGSRLHLSDMTLTHGSASHGGAIHAEESSVSLSGDVVLTANSASNLGGAVYASGSVVSWEGEGTRFDNNTAEVAGGAIHATNSDVSWDGDGVEFSGNSAGLNGGAISVVVSSSFSWKGDNARFQYNTAVGVSGSAIFASDSNVSWQGDGTEFSENSAEEHGGAIYVMGVSKLWWDGPTTFFGNIAGRNGGALAFVDFGYEETLVSGATFIENTSWNGGAIYVFNSVYGFNFSDVRFEANTASNDGGAFAAYSGTDDLPATFVGCRFFNNKANDTGGAIETLAGSHVFISCEFEGNSADVGGAARLGGSTDMTDCSFLSNSASSGGPAVSAIRTANISDTSFEGNEPICEAGSFRRDTEGGDPTVRFDTVCDDCCEWDDCVGCNITRGNVTPSCDSPLEHTTAEEPGVTLETLSVDSGYWRPNNESETILACYNADACVGGQTDSDEFCATGYTGPYCAVCEAGYSSSLSRTCNRCSSSRRQGLIAVTAIAAFLAIAAIVTMLQYMLSMELAERNIGCFNRWVFRAVPLQSLKIVVVVWQILTQFADAANVTYPSLYQDFLGAIDIINFDVGSMLSAGCLWSDIDFHHRLLLSTLGPLVLVGLLAITYWIAMHRSKAGRRMASAETIRHRHQTALLLLTFLVYSSVSSTVFQTFACETLDDGVEYLRADYRIHCTDAKHRTFQVYAAIMVIVYPAGIPLLYAALLFQRRHVLADPIGDKTSAQSIAGLWEPYRSECFYYEVIECGRRIMLTGVVVFIYPNDAAQIAVTMLFAFFFFAAFEILSPYKSVSDMWLSRGGHTIVFLTMFDLLMLKVDVSSESNQSQTIFAGVMVAGHVLMVLAIIAEIFGIYYASKKMRSVKSMRAVESFSGLRPRVGSDDAPPF
ncbi:unnamed protein product [Scytosiphon promiscuus]